MTFVRDRILDYRRVTVRDQRTVSEGGNELQVHAAAGGQAIEY